MKITIAMFFAVAILFGADLVNAPKKELTTTWVITKVEAEGFALNGEPGYYFEVTSTPGEISNKSYYEGSVMKPLTQFFKCEPKELKGKSFVSEYARDGKAALDALITTIKAKR